MYYQLKAIKLLETRYGMYETVLFWTAFDCFMLFSVIIFTKLKLHARNEIILSVNVSWGLGKTFLTSAVLNMLHFSRDLVFKEWSYAKIRLSIRWSSMR